MGTIIKSVGVARPLFRNRLLPLTFRASKICLKNGGISANDIGMILNAGVYNEKHQGEPAIASLIQNRLQSDYNRKRLPPKEPENIFSFDIHNGGGGILDAFRVADGFITSGEIDYGLIVAGDTKPASGQSINYNYSAAAGAVLLTKGPEEKGFLIFKSKTYTEFKNDFKSFTNWDTGNFRLIIDQRTCYLENCIKCAEDLTQRFLEEEIISLKDIDLIITSKSPLDFSGKFHKKIGFKDNISVKESNSEIYSAGLVFSLSNFFQNGKFSISKNILFVTVGSGITISLSLYRN